MSILLIVRIYDEENLFRQYWRRILSSYAYRTPCIKLWQPTDYKHLIRPGKLLNTFRQFRKNNSLKWELYRENPNKQI